MIDKARLLEHLNSLWENNASTLLGELIMEVECGTLDAPIGHEAAAPDLLEALFAIEKLTHRQMAIGEKLNKITMTAQAAIAKAKGGE